MFVKLSITSVKLRILRRFVVDRFFFFFFPGGNIKLKLLPTFWFRFVMVFLLLPKLRLILFKLLLLALMLLLMFKTRVMTAAMKLM